MKRDTKPKRFYSAGHLEGQGPLLEFISLSNKARGHAGSLGVTYRTLYRKHRNSSESKDDPIVFGCPEVVPRQRDSMD